MASSVPTSVVADDNPAAGILWMLLTMCLFVSMDTLAKFLTHELPTLQVAWGRFVFHMLWLAALLRRDLASVFLTGNLRMQLLRSTLLMLTTLLFFAGLRTTELSTATAIMFLSPIFVTLLAIPLLGERVGLRRFIGVLIGFIGALIIVHPRVDATAALDAVLPVADGIGWLPERGHLLLIGAAVCNASYQIMTRRLRLLDSPMTTLLYSGVVGSLVLSVWVPVVWVAPAPLTWLLLMAVGLLGCVSHFCLIRAFRHAPASLVVPFSYSALLWATLLGYVVFNSLPDHWTLLGALLIISSGLYIFYRENQVQRIN